MVGVLPARLLGPARRHTRRIKQLLPLSPSEEPSWVVFYREGEEVERAPPLCYALVELEASKGTSIEPIIATRDPRNDGEMVGSHQGEPKGKPENQLMTATDCLGAASSLSEHAYVHADFAGLKNGPFENWAYEHCL